MCLVGEVSLPELVALLYLSLSLIVEFFELGQSKVLVLLDKAGCWVTHHRRNIL